MVPLQGAPVPSLVRELRSHMPHRKERKKEGRKEREREKERKKIYTTNSKPTTNIAKQRVIPNKPIKEIKWNHLKIFREFPGGPVVRTPCFYCQGPRFNSWLGN